MWQQLKVRYHYHKGCYARQCAKSRTLYDHQQEKLATLLSYLYARVKFYQEFSGRLFTKLPIINKSILQENFQTLNTYQFTLHQVTTMSRPHPYFHVHQSTGTANKEAVYFFSLAEKAYELGHLLNTLDGRFKKIALFHLSKRPYFPFLFSEREKKWHFFDLNQSFEMHCRRLNELQPQFLIAPVQTLCRLAQLQQEEKIRLHPTKIIATAEVLMPGAAHFISQVFKQQVHQLYQCAEGWLGATCSQGTLHLNEELYYIEKEWISDKKDRFVPVITALSRFAQPLVRYRMEDILVVKPTPCACGSPLLAIDKIIGRCEDVLYFPLYAQPRELKPVFSDNMQQALSADLILPPFQIIQHSLSHVVVKMQDQERTVLLPQLQNNLDKLWQAHGVKPPLVEFDSLNHALNTMFRQTQRLAPTSLIG